MFFRPISVCAYVEAFAAGRSLVHGEFVDIGGEGKKGAEGGAVEGL
jgi:hypothetical protein